MTSSSDSERSDSLTWLVSVLGGRIEGPTHPMLARPDRHHPEMLLPLTNRQVSAASLLRHHDGRGPATRLTSLAARAGARAGQLARMGGDRVDFPATAVLTEVGRALGCADLIPAIGLGPERRNRKPVVMLISPAGRVHAYVKVGWSDFTRELVDNEERWLRRLDGRIAAPFRAPTPLARVESDTALALAVTPLRFRGATRPRTVAADDLDRLARSLGTRMEKVVDLPWLADPAWGTGTDRTAHDLRGAVAAVVDRHAEVELETGLWHGDMNPWNRITLPDGVGLFDWEFAGDHRPIGQDALHLELEAFRRTSSAAPAEVVGAFLQRHGHTADPVAGARVDVYLADLAIRESQLSGQGWSGPLDGYRKPLACALAARVDR